MRAASKTSQASTHLRSLSLGLTLGLIFTGPLASAECKSRLTQSERGHHFNISWQAPTQFEDNTTGLSLNEDIWGYYIWRVDSKNPTQKIEILATADRHDTHCQVFVREAGEYSVAMESVAHETSALSAQQVYATTVAPVATVARK